MRTPPAGSITVGARLTGARKAAGLRLTDLAEALGEVGSYMAPSQLSRVENGKRGLYAKEARALAAVLGLNEADLLPAAPASSKAPAKLPLAKVVAQEWTTPEDFYCLAPACNWAPGTATEEQVSEHVTTHGHLVTVSRTVTQVWGSDR